jgi:hypothetical protein
MNVELLRRFAEFANQRVLGAKQKQAFGRSDADNSTMHPANGGPFYPLKDHKSRKKACDCYV